VRLLIVEDDDIVADAIKRGLAAANYSVHRVASAEAAQAALVNEEFAMAVIDVGLPGADGLTLVRRRRSAGKTMPTLILTARCTLSDKVKALDLGADDYVTKPFGIDELLARIRAAQRHRLQQEGERPLFHAGDLSVDLVRRIVTVRGSEVKLSPREFDVLRLMAAHAGKVLTHRFMLEEIWGADADVQYLRVYIRGLRQKIEADPERPTHILTETGVGYRLREPDP